MVCNTLNFFSVFNESIYTNYYLSYSIEREGIAKPKIRKIVLIDHKGDVIDESGFEYSFYADYGSRIGAFRDDIIDNDGIIRIEKLKDIKGYYVEGRENEAIVIKVSFEERFDVTSIHGFKIYYSVLGIPKCKSQRVISFRLGIEL